jgi:hypothetical protein
MGQVGRFTAVDAVRYPRRSRVIVRTRRGLEIGEVLTPPKDDGGQARDWNGIVNKRMKRVPRCWSRKSYRPCWSMLSTYSMARGSTSISWAR